jgi:hypothetical protein
MLRSFGPRTNPAFVVLSFLCACAGRVDPPRGQVLSEQERDASIDDGPSPADNGPRGDATMLDVAPQDAVLDRHDAGVVDASDAALDAGFDSAAEAASDASPCDPFQPQPVWTTTSASFDLTVGVSGDACDSGFFQFSEAARTLSGDACIAGERSRWLVHLTQAQVEAIVAKAQAVQTRCEPNCTYALFASRLSVQSEPQDASATNYEDCLWDNSEPPFQTDAGILYMDVLAARDLASTLFGLIVAACDPDAGGGDPATCVPIAPDD